MKKKLNKIAALVLALVMVITGFVAVPEMDVQAADDVPSIITKTDVTKMKPGDTVHVECWLKPNGNVMQVIGGFDFDTKVYTYVKGSLDKDPNNALKKDFAFIVGEEDVYTAGGFSVLLQMEENYPVKQDILLFTFDVTVNENAKGSGLMGFNCKGIETGTNDADKKQIDGKDVPVKTLDKSGNEIKDGQIPVVIELASLNIKEDNFTLSKGSSKTLTVEGTPAAAFDKDAVVWTSSNKNVATVENGEVKAVGVGTATITASLGGKSDTVKVTVDNPLTGITLDQTTLALEKNQSATLKVKYTPEDTTDSKTVKWESSDATVAKVDQNGKVTALKDGTATIKATVGKFTAECAVTVKRVPLTGISLDKTTLELSKGQSSEALKVIYNPANTTDDKTVTWTSANENIATVKNGVVTAKAVGETKITATVGTHKAECTVTVNAKLTGIKVTPDKVTVEKGQTANLNVAYLPADTTDKKAVTWKSENENVATVDANGVVTAVAGGTTKIVATATANDKITAVCEVKVPIHTESIELNETEIIGLRKGDTEKLTVSFKPANTEDSKEVKWTSSDSTVASVDKNGVVKGLKEGEATITVTTADGKHTASCVVKVKEVSIDLDKVELAQDTPNTLLKGQQHKIKVVFNQDEEPTETATYEYKSLDESIASVDANGVVTALKAGQVMLEITVKASSGSMTIMHYMEVKEIPLESISIKGDVTSLEEGKTTKLNVVFNPTNTTDDKTVVWSSSDTKVATVDANGVVKAVKAGTVKITAKVGDKTAEYALTVTAKANGTNNKNENPANGGAVQTGDSSHVSGFAVAMLLSMAAIAGVVIFKKRVHR